MVTFGKKTKNWSLKIKRSNTCWILNLRNSMMKRRRNPSKKMLTQNLVDPPKMWLISDSLLGASLLELKSRFSYIDLSNPCGLTIIWELMTVVRCRVSKLYFSSVACWSIMKMSRASPKILFLKERLKINKRSRSNK